MCTSLYDQLKIRNMKELGGEDESPYRQTCMKFFSSDIYSYHPTVNSALGCTFQIKNSLVFYVMHANPHTNLNP